jgi:hypothetical protein
MVLPRCARFVFEGSRLRGHQLDASGQLRRNPQIMYRFPEADRASASLPSQPAALRLGARASIRVDGPGTVVWYDHAGTRWRTFDIPEAPRPTDDEAT